MRVVAADGARLSAPIVDRQEWLTAYGSAGPAAPLPDPGFAAHAERWLVYVSAEPASSLDDLRAAVAAHVPRLVLTPPE